MKTNKSVLMAFFPLLALVFFACQKDVSQSPSLTSNAKGANAPVQPQGANPEFSVTLTTVLNHCDEQTFRLSAFDPGGAAVNPGTGRLQLLIYDDAALSSLVENYDAGSGPTYDVTTHLDPGTYYLVGKFYNGGGNPATMLRATTQSSVEVEACATCTPGLFGNIGTPERVGDDGNGNITFRFTLTVNLEDCDNSYSGKIQGGLVKGATVEQILNGGYIRQNNGQSQVDGAPVIEWDNVGSGTYTVIYTLTRKAGSNDVTGDWSYSANPTYVFSKIYFTFQ